METQQKKETQENFTNNYDESKVIDIKAMGLVKKRDRKDLEKDPINSINSNEAKLEQIENSKDKIVKLNNGNTHNQENKI